MLPLNVQLILETASRKGPLLLAKDALHALLVEFSPNRAWAPVNLRRNKPFSDQRALEDIPLFPGNRGRPSNISRSVVARVSVPTLVGTETLIAFFVNIG